MLTGKQRRHLRSLGHSLNPIVTVGKDGVTPGVAAAIDQALDDHELIKVRIGQNAIVDHGETAAALADQTSSELAQIIGSTFLLYRRHPDEPKIKLPR